MPVYMEETIPDLARIYINGGRKGYLVGMEPKDAVKVLKPQLVKVGIL
jgi:prolyl-tRNA editing enzyme YbaK/EbsC (Cys-tRNA(Pro) deacylase)